MLTELQQMQRRPARSEHHAVTTLNGQVLRGTWEEILDQLKASDRSAVHQSLGEFMATQARRGKQETGVVIPVTTAEAFIRGSAEAGVVRILH
jgi:hypothetical protein